MESTQGCLSTSAPEAVVPFGPTALHWIAIIGMVASTFLIGGGYLLKKARTLQAKTAIKGLAIAMNGYETEYGRAVGKSLGDKVGLTEGHDSLTEGDLLATLMQLSMTHNPRKVRFYDPPAAKGQVNGAWFDATGVVHLSDPWGAPYRLRADLNGDGLIPDPAMPAATVKAQYLIYSAGPDGDPSTWKDNVVSWK